jgi:hypothetical protein
MVDERIVVDAFVSAHELSARSARSFAPSSYSSTDRL